MAGRIRLAVTGIQDQWLTGEPQFSYFVMNYKRHTRFSTEAVEMPFDGKCDFSSSVECRIPQNIGDLIRSTMLKIKLGKLSTDTSTEKYRYNTPAALSIIKYVDLVIGGQIIERLTGDYIYMYNQLHNNKDDVNQSLYFLSGHGEHLQVSDSYNTFYVNIPFYFFRNPSLAVPVCAITKQLVEVRVTFKDVNDDVTFKYTINGSVTTRDKTTEGSIDNVSLITDFYFVAEEERNFLLTRPMEYIISQLQMSKLVYKPNESKKSALLKFKHPVKELFFSAKEKTGITNVTESGYTISQLGNDIDGEAAGDRSGRAVSISADGTRIAIGAYTNDGFNGVASGHVRVYEWNSATPAWEQVGQDIDGEAAGDQSGYSVSMSSDGSRVAIGAWGNDGTGSDAGHVRVFALTVFPDGSRAWFQVGQDIDGEAAGDRSGSSVSMSSDGTRVAIGALYNNGANGGASGHVRVFYDNAGTWTQLGSDIDGEAASDYSGIAVSMSRDGTHVAIGATANDGNTLYSACGHVRVYVYNSPAWEQVGGDIDGKAASDQSGNHVSMSSDGTRVAIGANYNDDNGSVSGHVRVYEWNSVIWTQMGSDIAGEDAYDLSGAVSMSSDGTRMAIGASRNDGANGVDSGHVRVYEWNNVSWTQVGSDIDGKAANDKSGWSVSMSSDGTRVVIGNFETGSGHTRVYLLSGTSGGSEDRLLNISSSDQEFTTLLPGKRSDHRLIKNVKFACNGETIFDQSGQYLAYEQSLRYHTGCPDPAFEFYSYSFSLKPEQHYPSGQLNMSRIMHKKIDIELEETSTTRDIDVSVYALNYNVLHVASGLVGLKF